MGRRSGFTHSPETRATISAVMSARARERKIARGVDVEARPARAVGRPKLSPEQKQVRMLERAVDARIRRKMKWYPYANTR